MLHVVLPIMLASVMAFLWTLMPKLRGFSGRDNHATREWQSRLEGWKKRSTWAHQNALETLPIFIGAVICAHLGHPGSTLAAGLAYAYVGLRALYGYFYISDRAQLRSGTWGLSMAAIAALYVSALL